MSAPTHPPLPDRFEVLEELSASPNELLLRARDRQLGREVFLKLAKVARPSSDALREARMLARVQHPGVCRLFEVIETASGPLLVLEPCTGETLAEALDARGRLDAEEVRRLGRAVAEAAHAAHAVGVVHRGIAEHAILLRADGEPMLTGFEFAKPDGHGLGLSSLNYSKRTTDDDAAPPGLPHLPAPEQLEGRAADARSDVFSLGCVLFRCLAGAPAFATDDDLVAGRVGDLAAAARGAPRPLVAAILRCLAPSPSKRFQTMQQPVEALAVPAAATTADRRPAWLRTAVVAGIVAIGGGLALRLGGGREDGRRGLRPEHEPGAVAPATSGYLPLYTGAHAVLIGIDYRGAPAGLPPLENAERDVVAIAEKLRQLGWRDVVTLLGAQATRAAIETALSALETASDDEQLFVYYAGHGKLHPNATVRPEAGGFVIPWDGGRAVAGRTDGDDWIHFSRFDRLLTSCKAKHVLVAYDCCHAGSALVRAVPDAYRQEFLTRRARLKIASARPEQEALDESCFASVFLAGLDRARTEAVTATELYAEMVRRTGSGGTLHRQSPVLRRVDGDSEFVFLQLDD